MEKNKVLADTFKWLFIGLLVSFIVSLVSTSSLTIANLVYGSFNGYGYIIFLVLEFVIAVVLGHYFRKLSKTTTIILYLLYTALTGLSLSGIYLIYTSGSIAIAFLITSLIFGLFSLIGYNTKIDLSKYGIYLIIAFVSVIILEIINVFILSNTLNIIGIGLLIVIFCLYIAYDVNMIINSYISDENNASIYFAFQLFLDFVNLFIEILKILGRRRKE